MKELAPKIFSVIFNALLIAIAAVVLSPGDKLIQVSDLPIFYAAAWMATHGQGALMYDLNAEHAAKLALFPALEGNTPLYQAPLGIPLYTIFTIVPASIALQFWSGAFVLLMAISIQILADYFKLSRRQTMWLGVAAALSGPVWEETRVEQLSAIFLLMLSISLILQKRNRNLLAGVCQSFWCPKPHLLLPLLAYQFGGRRWNILAGTVLGVILFFLVSLVEVGGFSAYAAFVQAIPKEFKSSMPTAGGSEPSLRGQLLASGATALALSPLPTAAYACVLVLLLWLGHRFRKDPLFIEKGLLTALPLSIIFSLHVHNYELIWLIPSVLASAVVFSDVRTKKKILFALPLLVFMNPVYIVTHYFYVLPGGKVNPFFLILLGYEIALLACLVRQPRPSEPEVPQSPQSAE